MKRILFILLLTVGFALGLNGQAVKTSKYDTKLEEQIQSGNLLQNVRVIIQSPDVGALTAKLSSLLVSNVQQFTYFPGVAAELPLSTLTVLALDPIVTAISSDEPMKSTDSSDGTEPPNSSSGGLAAIERWNAAGDGVGIAIIDSGIASHADLNNVVYRANFTGSTTLGKTDPYGHGTHVAGIAAGSGKSSGGVYAGVAPKARLIDLRVLDGSGAGYTSDVIAAIDWAIKYRNSSGYDGKSMNIRVINLSLGHKPYESAATDPLSVACRKAVQAGLVVVAAAGNYGKDSKGTPVYGAVLTPGIEPSVITVGAVTTWGTPSRSDDVVASYSSKGPTLDGLLKPDLTAPGSRLVSTLSSGSALINAHPELQVGTQYMKLSGTSMATPVVSGAAAMLLSRVPTLTPNVVKAILMYTAENRGNPLGWGTGYVNILGGMDLAMRIDPSVSVNKYWVKPGQTLPSSALINGYNALWSRTVGWGGQLYSGNSALYNKPSWSTTIVWGETIVWSETIVWGETYTVEASVSAEVKNVAGLVMSWSDPSAQTIVWSEESTWSQTSSGF